MYQKLFFVLSLCQVIAPLYGSSQDLASLGQFGSSIELQVNDDSTAFYGTFDQEERVIMSKSDFDWMGRDTEELVEWGKSSLLMNSLYAHVGPTIVSAYLKKTSGLLTALGTVGTELFFLSNNWLSPFKNNDPDFLQVLHPDRERLATVGAHGIAVNAADLNALKSSVQALVEPTRRCRLAVTSLITVLAGSLISAQLDYGYELWSIGIGLSTESLFLLLNYSQIKSLRADSLAVAKALATLKQRSAVEENL